MVRGLAFVFTFTIALLLGLGIGKGTCPPPAVVATPYERLP